MRRLSKVSGLINRYEYRQRERAERTFRTKRRFTYYRYHYLNTYELELKMSLTDEDIAFLIKIGQITEAPKKDTKAITPTTEKSEE